MRIGGVSVGKVKSIELAPPDKRVDGKDTTEARSRSSPQFAPISTDARAILRQKTLLGETYVELTSGTKPGTQRGPVSLGAAADVSDAQTQDVETIPEGGTLGVSRDRGGDPDRRDLQRPRQGDAHRRSRLAGRTPPSRSTAAGIDLNDSFGNLGPFVTDASDIIDVLDRQKDGAARASSATRARSSRP